MIKVSKKDLKNIEIEVNEIGFTIWVKEKFKNKDGEYREIEHWILDGSCLMEDGEMRLGDPNHWKVNAKYDESENKIYVTRK